MKIQLDRNTLLTPLQTVIGVVGNNPTLAILSNVLIDIKQSQLRITGSDTEVELVGHTQTPTPTEHLFTLPGKKLVDILRTLPDSAPVELYCKDSKVTLTSGKSRFTLSTADAEDFPTFKQTDTQLTFEMPQNQLRNLFLKTQVAIAQQDVRYYLNGLMFEINTDHIKAVATDGHRLAYSHSDIEIDTTHRLQIIIPRKAIIELVRLLEDNDEKIKLEIGTNSINVHAKKFDFSSKLIEGRFPDYERVIPKNNNTLISINREFLQEVLQRVAIVGNISARLEFKENRLHVFVNNSDKSENAEDELMIDYTGAPFNIAFNIQYVLDALNNISTEEVAFHMDGPDASSLITEPGNDSFKYVVMPLRI